MRRWGSASRALRLPRPDACAGRTASTPVPSRSRAFHGPAASVVRGDAAWLAGLPVERADPDTLDEDSPALTEPSADRWWCRRPRASSGLPSDVASSDYMLGAVAPDQFELDDLLARIGAGSRWFEVEVTVLCAD